MKQSQYTAPPEVIRWFLRRFIVGNDDALEFAERLHHIIDHDTLSTDQKKRINYNLKRKYTWLNFIIEDANRRLPDTSQSWRVYPKSADAEWASGIIYDDEDGRLTFQSSPVKDLLRLQTG